MKTTYWMSAVLIVLAACRPDPGPNDYEQQEPFDFPDEGSGGAPADEVLPGPDPFEAGEQRLSIGFAYEGEASDAILIDGNTTHLYIYEETLVLAPSSDRIEGTTSLQIDLVGSPWWGMGVHWDTARDLSAWDTLHISFRSSDAAFDEIEIGLSDAEVTASVMATAYGWAADGSWHNLTIPVADFVEAGLSVSAAETGLVLLGGAGADASLLVDAVYYTAE